MREPRSGPERLLDAEERPEFLVIEASTRAARLAEPDAGHAGLANRVDANLVVVDHLRHAALPTLPPLLCLGIHEEHIVLVDHALIEKAMVAEAGANMFFLQRISTSEGHNPHDLGELAKSTDRLERARNHGDFLVAAREQRGHAFGSLLEEHATHIKTVHVGLVHHRLALRGLV